MYISVIVKDDAVKGLAVSATSALFSNYVIDMMNNTAYETTNPQTDDTDAIYTYQYIGDMDKIQAPMHQIISNCQNHIACDVMAILREFGIRFSTGFISNNKDAKMDFIYRA